MAKTLYSSIFKTVFDNYVHKSGLERLLIFESKRFNALPN